MLQRKSQGVERSSSTSDLKIPLDKDLLIRSIADEIVNAVVDKELRLILINSLGKSHFKNSLLRIIGQEIVDEVVDELLRKEVVRLLKINKISENIANEIIDEVVKEELQIMIQELLDELTESVEEPKEISVVEKSTSYSLGAENVAVQTCRTNLRETNLSKSLGIIAYHDCSYI